MRKTQVNLVEDQLLADAERLVQQALTFVGAHSDEEQRNHATRVAASVSLVAQPIALLHDFCEVGSEEIKAGIKETFPGWVVGGLIVFTRRPNESTLDYLLRIKTALPVTVLQADLEDQLDCGHHRGLPLTPADLDNLALQLYALRA
jgi:hypothetical protein